MKRNWIKNSLIALFGAGIAAGGLSACSNTPRGYGHGGGDHAEWQGRMIERVADKLELDTSQKQKLDVLATKLREQRQTLRGTGAEPRAEMQALIAGDTFDRARAQALIDEKIAAVHGKSPEVIAAMADFYDSLNQTQQQQVRDFAKARRGGWRRHG